MSTCTASAPGIGESMRLAGDIRTISTAAPPDDFTDHAADDDARLVALARADPAAFAPLYERYAQSIYYFCYRRLGNRHDAADATAIVFTRTLTALGSFHPRAAQPGSTFRAWLYTTPATCSSTHNPAQYVDGSPATCAPAG